MHTYFVEYLQALRSQHAALKQTLLDAPAAALDWSPTPDANSLTVLVVHVAGAQRYLLGDLLERRPSQRNRDSEFSTHQVDAASLIALLDAAMAEATAFIEPLTLDDLAQERYSARHDRNFTVAWLLNHALEHAAQHVGHAQLTRQLWDQQESV